MTILFDGVDDRCDINGFSVPLTSTVCFWVRFQIAPVAERLFGAGDKWEIRITGAGQPFRSDMRDTGTPIESVTVPVADTWYHLAMSNNNVSPFENRIWVNGLFETTGNNNNDASTGGYTAYSHACRFPNTDNAEIELEDVRIYNRVLSDAEVATIHACRGHDEIVEGLLYRHPHADKEPGSVGSPSPDIALQSGNATPQADLVGGPVYGASQMSYRRRVA